jgi:predicted DNA binding CopG/RHH family protein
MSNIKRGPTPQAPDYLREGEAWDRKSVSELSEEFEPIDAVFVDERATKKAISIRIDPHAVETAKRIARELGTGYQTLFRMWVMEGLARYDAKKPAASRGLSPSATRKQPKAHSRTAA